MKYLKVKEPHICLYRDDVEIVLIKSKPLVTIPNRHLHGCGYDGYFTTLEPQSFYEEVCKNNIPIAKPLNAPDYGNQKFVLEDIDGR